MFIPPSLITVTQLEFESIIEFVTRTMLSPAPLPLVIVIPAPPC